MDVGVRGLKDHIIAPTAIPAGLFEGHRLSLVGDGIRTGVPAHSLATGGAFDGLGHGLVLLRAGAALCCPGRPRNSFHAYKLVGELGTILTEWDRGCQ